MGILERSEQSQSSVQSQGLGAPMKGFAEAAWRSLEADDGIEPARFDPGTLGGLPSPAQRLLAAALPDRTPLASTVVLEMVGDIRLAGRWMPFTARQILRARLGFVWAPIVGGRLIRFTGADVLGRDGARMEFRLHGRIPVVQGSGVDIERGARGRLAAETVAWLPHALTPQAGARWEAIDDARAAVILDVAGTDVRVQIEVGDQGQIMAVGLQRWKDSAKPAAYAPFGGSVELIYADPTGVRIAGAGTVGWDWQTPQQTAGQFFRYRIVNATFAPPVSDGVSR